MEEGSPNDIIFECTREFEKFPQVLDAIIDWHFANARFSKEYAVVSTQRYLHKKHSTQAFTVVFFARICVLYAMHAEQ